MNTFLRVNKCYLHLCFLFRSLKLQNMIWHEARSISVHIDKISQYEKKFGFVYLLYVLVQNTQCPIQRTLDRFLYVCLFHSYCHLRQIMFYDVLMTSMTQCIRVGSVSGSIPSMDQLPNLQFLNWLWCGIVLHWLLVLIQFWSGFRFSYCNQ